jgi:trafficking protein particle complex subunit 12
LFEFKLLCLDPAPNPDNVSEDAVADNAAAEEDASAINPFLIDDDEPTPDADEQFTENDIAQTPNSDDIPLSAAAQSSMFAPFSAAAQRTTFPNLNKDVPPPPSQDSDQEEEDTPDLYLPSLVNPSMFLPIPNVRCPHECSAFADP